MNISQFHTVALAGLLALGLALPAFAQEQEPIPPAESLERAYTSPIWYTPGQP